MRWWVVVVVVMAASASVQGAAADTENSAGNGLDETVAEAAETLTSGGLFGPQLRNILGALENVDEMLRSTLPAMDRFQCLERVMCSMATTSFFPEQTPSAPVAQLPGFDPSFQQGLILDPSTVQQGFPGLVQNPSTIQQGFQQGLQQGFPGLVQNPSTIQQGFQQGLQQGFPGFVQNPSILQQGPQQGLQQTLQQGLQQGLQQTLQQGLQQTLQQGLQVFPNPGAPLPGQGGQSGLQSLLGGTSFQNLFPSFRQNPDTSARSAAQGGQNRRVVVRRRRPGVRRRRPQRRGGFMSFLNGMGRRKKRNAVSDFLSSITSNRFMGLLDQMMTRYSFYPYTHAAYMGYTGDPNRCETLYPSCPSTPEQMIDVFNNMHKHFPNGVPFKDSMPWPLNLLLP